MKTKQYLIIGVSLFLLIIVLTNPGREKYKEDVKLKMSAFVEKEIKDKMILNDELSMAKSLMVNVLANS